MSTRVSKRTASTAHPRPRNRTAMFATGALVLAGVAIAIWAGGKALIPEHSAPAEQTAMPETSPEPAVTKLQPITEEAEEPLFSGSMLSAEKEQSPAPAEPAQTAPENALPFELEQVASALSRVEVDENGDVVLNEAAQTVLEQAFMDARTTLSEQQLADLKTMIEAGLGGQAGEQAVQIADKFYRYSNAFREVSDTLAMRSDPQSLRSDYEQVSRLRRTHLGPELAKQLYHREEQLTRYTLDVMAIQADPDLTPEQRSEKQQELASRYPEVMPNGGESDEEGEQVTN